MYRNWIWRENGKAFLEVHEADNRSLLAEMIGWGLVDLSTKLGPLYRAPYALGNKLINWGNDREQKIQIIPLTKAEAKAFDWDDYEA